MQVQSLALATDLGLLRTRGARIDDRGDHLVVETPDDPSYHFGNLIAAPHAPAAGELATWTRRFADAFAHQPAIRHVTLQWDDPRGEVPIADELAAAGFEVEVCEVRTATALVAPARAPDGVTLRPLVADEVARAAADLGFAIGERHDEAYHAFLRRRAAWHADLVARGVARFWGAFAGTSAALIGSLGLVTLEDTLGGTLRRYQDVQTALAFRGRGIASALLVAAAAEGTAPLVIVNVLGAPAGRIYERVGLRAVERVGSACKAPS